MTTAYKTKRDINGNTYYLIINHDNKTFTEHGRLLGGYDYITVTKKQRRQLKEQYKEAGYKSID